jgi:hypothetical protein
MIIITEAKIIETKESMDEIIFTRRPNDPIRYKCEIGKEKIVPVSVIRESIKGRRFVRARDNTDVIIGCSKQIQDIIGIQYESFDNIIEELRLTNNLLMATSKEAAKNNNKIKGYELKIDYFNDASFWTRLKWLFFGVK